MYSQDWNIKARAAKCSKCENEFEDGQYYISRLNFGSGGYDRSDFCEGCWAKRSEAESGVSSWRGLFKSPPPASPEPVRKETAETLLRRMIETGEESRLNVIFILAVMLERRRVLVERDVKQQSGGMRLRIYEHRGTGETFVVADPMLRMDQLQEVQREVLDMLEPHNAPGH